MANVAQNLINASSAVSRLSKDALERQGRYAGAYAVARRFRGTALFRPSILLTYTLKAEAAE